MKKKLLLSLLPLLLCSILLCACGGSIGGLSYDSKTAGLNSMSDYVTESADYYYDGSDYSNTNISGDLVDYSYSVGAEGILEEKSAALSFYESVQKYVDENDGYIEDVNNTYYGNEIVDDYYISKSDVKYKASGRVSFVVQIDNSKVEDIVGMFDDFCKKYGFAVVDYNQYVRNYENANVVDEYSEWYRYDEITEKDLQKRIKYSDISVNIDYSIKRSPSDAFMVGIKRFWIGISEAMENVVIPLLTIVCSAFVVLFICVLPVRKLYIKSMYKYYVKYPEYNTIKKISICNLGAYIAGTQQNQSNQPNQSNVEAEKSEESKISEDNEDKQSVDGDANE